jgi:peroxiredoxin
MSLREELEKQQARWDEKTQGVYEDLVRQLGAAETADRALKVGAKAPEFALPDAEGRLVHSDELLERGSLVINFFRGDWCPFCRIALKALNEALPAISAAGAQLIAISPDTGGRLLRAKKGLGLSIDLLSDVDNGVALAFGVAFRITAAYQQTLVSFDINLPELHGNEGWIVPIPATFVVDRTGIVRYAFVEPAFVRRAEPGAIIAALQQPPNDAEAPEKDAGK